jgi:hypothetical protein
MSINEAFPNAKTSHCTSNPRNSDPSRPLFKKIESDSRTIEEEIELVGKDVLIIDVLRDINRNLLGIRESLEGMREFGLRIKAPIKGL